MSTLISAGRTPTFRPKCNMGDFEKQRWQEKRERQVNLEIFKYVVLLKPCGYFVSLLHKLVRAHETELKGEHIVKVL